MRMKKKKKMKTWLTLAEAKLRLPEVNKQTFSFPLL